MQRAYTQKFSFSGRYFAFVETPRLNTWIRLDGFQDDEQKMIDWLTELGYKVVTKEESYERQKESSR